MALCTSDHTTQVGLYRRNARAIVKNGRLKAWQEKIGLWFSPRLICHSVRPRTQTGPPREPGVRSRSLFARSAVHSIFFPDRRGQMPVLCPWTQPLARDPSKKMPDRCPIPGIRCIKPCWSACSYMHEFSWWYRHWQLVDRTGKLLHRWPFPSRTYLISWQRCSCKQWCDDLQKGDSAL